MSSFNTALSALKANASALDVVGNNLANLNSTGFKASSVAFSDLASMALSGVGSVAEGAGVNPPKSTRQFTQGGIQVTSGRLDAAIQGNGFFVVRDSQGASLYTRAGNFKMDSAGNLLTQFGQRVQGWNATGGVVNANGAATDIVLPTGTISPPVAATNFAVTVNLNASAVVDTPGATFSAPVQVIDSLGGRHTLTVTYTKTDINTWDYEITIPGTDLADGDPDEPTSLATGTLTFDAEGRLEDPAVDDDPPEIEIEGFANGAADMTLTWSLYDAAAQPLLTQFAQPSAVSAIDQDGRGTAALVSVAIVDGGRIIGQYSDGSQQIVAQLALANFRNPETLTSAGNNNLATGAETSAPAIGAASTGGRGDVAGGSLETSTVDIAREFTNMIVFQRGYQANSRVITTMNELTQETINLVR
jgi:flagellar hook protein FlgE